jgi:predicted DNA-binding protein
VSVTRAKQKEERANMFTTTISLSPEVHQKLKHLAVDLGVPFRDLIREAIDGYLEQCKRSMDRE